MTLAIGHHTYNVLRDQQALTDWNRSTGGEQFKSLFSQTKECNQEAVRLKTFLLWPTWGKAEPSKLAEEGFYFTGDDDKVKCYKCNVEVNNWKDLAETPAEVHKRKSPYCDLVNKEKTDNVPLHPEPPKGSKGRKRNRTKKTGSADKQYNNDSPNDSPDEIDNGSVMADSMASVSEGAAAATGKSHMAKPLSTPFTKSAPLEEWNKADLQIEENRLVTFQGQWPEDCPVPYKQVAKAGFWYKGPKDRVECAFCRGRLVNWVAGDDPVGEHARHFPACPFIQELNNEPMRVLKMRSARAMMRLGYHEAKVLMAINTCKQQGNNNPNAEAIQEAIFEIEEEEVTKKEQLKAAAAERLRSDGLHSGTDREDSNLDSSLSSPEVHELKKKNEELKMSTICKVCLGKEVNCVFLPCRHLVCCNECASKVEYCPVCRLKIIGTVKTFMA